MPIAELEPGTVVIPAQEIERQLARMLESHHFCHSHRYPALLRFLVEQTQNGKGGQLKERLLGIEVFHRAPDYDTNTDPVVRVTAAEVRKRIAQYYQEPEHSGEIRIDLPTGSYVPRFCRPTPMVRAPEIQETTPGTTGELAAGDLLEPRPEVVEESVLERRWPPWSWLLVAAAVCFGAGATFVGMRALSGQAPWRERALHEFWAPFTGGDTPVLVVIGDHTIGFQGNALRAEQGTVASPGEDVLKLMNEYQQITISDVSSLLRVTNYMVRRQQPYTVAGAGAADIPDLRNGPVMLFAGLDNRWTMRLDAHLRYRFVDSADDTVGSIEDSQNPGRNWQVDFKVPYSRMQMDYAIVARYIDPLIEEPVMVVAGLAATGTASASEFVTSERMLEDLQQLRPKTGKHDNVEVVLAMPVIDGHPGPPHVVAAQFW